jgi:molybdopterin-containing oxidoreductase family molybdopterin binding subunit
VVDGKLVKTAPRLLPYPPYQRICLRGLSHAQWVYNPDRLKYPMKRVGKRGEGKWKRISWDEAIDEIAAKFTDIRDRYGSKAVAFAPLSGNSGAVNGSYAPGVFENLFQATTISFTLDAAMMLGLTQTGGFPLWSAGNEPLDMSNSDLVILWGSNMTETDVQNWHFVQDAKDRGAKLVVIDPHYSTTASKADVWLPVRPGSDAALGLSMINVIISEKLYNKPFVLEHTTLPFLVRSDDGMFLRAPDVETPTLWDPKSKAAVPLGQVADPAREGSYTVDGLGVKPAFQMLVEHVAAWTPHQAARYTEIAPDKARWLART